MMKAEDFQKAVDILSQELSVQLSFNVPIKDNYANTHQILIHRSNASTVNKLVEAGFSLHMTDKGLAVNKY